MLGKRKKAKGEVVQSVFFGNMNKLLFFFLTRRGDHFNKDINQTPTLLKERFTEAKT